VGCRWDESRPAPQLMESPPERSRQHPPEDPIDVLGPDFPLEPSELPTCDLCGMPAEELREMPFRLRDGTKGVDYACERCRAVLDAAETLLDNDVTDENVIVTTLAVAASDGMTWPMVGEEPPEDFALDHPEFELTRAADGKPLLHMRTFVVHPIRYTGTNLPKEIRIEAFSKVAKAGEVAARYEEILRKENIPSENCTGFSFECDTDNLILTMSVKPRAELDPIRIKRLTTYPQAPAHHLPPPNIIREFYRELLGSTDDRTFRGSAYALGDHGRSQTKSQGTNILACLAWCFGEGHNTSTPAERRPRISRALNRHLLSPYGMTELPENGWSSDQAVWGNIKEVAQRFMRASYLWQRPTIR
jgi:hypothetical protein